ncbi:ABC transporter permease [Clostridium vincentii]|uniref:FtsX-like permease family protein n=1 Tax=Clostridium vincentii TaxID=52704 RepID=A0A2T0BFU5_9CLOT|nr:FtsX-like permease family protein [Clostridium vincentii]PRR82760.1 FtsX-like permease family protein [Clostridium vincentii]
MEKLRILAFNQIRKNKGQFISFGLILILAASIFHLGVITELNFGKSFDEKWEKLNAADIFVTMMKYDYQDEFLDRVKKIDGVSQAETRDCILMNGSVKYSGNEMNMPNVFYNMDDEYTFNELSIQGDSDESVTNPIYLSYWMKAGGGYGIGDEYNYKVEDTNYTFTVAGFVEDILYGTRSLLITGVYLPEDSYRKLDNQVDVSQKAITVSAKAENILDSREISSKVSDLINGKMQGSYFSSYYDVCKQSRTMLANMEALIFIAFAMLIVIVSLLVSNFRINNSIEEEMQNMGALKALGYTGKQIILVMITPYIGIGAITIVLGSILSYGLLPALESSFNSQTGLIWIQGFSFSALLVTVAFILGMIATISYLSARKIKKLKPIEALRGGIATHNFRKNHFPIEKTKGNVNFILALKNLCGNVRQNILLFVVIVAVTLSTIFAGTMFYNSVIKTEVFMKAITEEMPSVSLSFANGDNEIVKSDIENMSEVKQVLYYNEDNAIFEDEKLPLFITEDYSLMDNDICYEGRNPIHENEIALGSTTAKNSSLTVGDTITLSYGGNSSKYLITGLIQSVNYNGEAAEITEKGFKQINEKFDPTNLYVYLNDESETGDFIDEMTEKYNNNIVGSMDYVKSADSAIGVFVNVIGIMCGVILLVTALLVVMILYLLIKTVIVRKKEEMGILKSMGYTTRQLIFQTALSFMPTTFVATLIGSLIGFRYMNSILAVLLSGLGIMKISFSIPIAMLIIIVVGLPVFAFLISVMLSRKIKYISAYSLIKE